MIAHSTCIKLLENNVRDFIQQTYYFQIVKYLIISSHTNDISKYMDIFDTIFITTDCLYTKMEIADIFLLNNRQKRGNEMLAIIRELEAIQIEREREREMEEFTKTGKHIIYNDTQNVHNTKINKSVLNASVNLIRSYKPKSLNTEDIFNYLSQVIIDNINSIQQVKDEHPQIVIDVIEKVIERIEIEKTKFSHKKDVFTLYDLFGAIWSFISKHIHKKELEFRLVEEMYTMNKYCTTGHLSRFVNVIQGFTDNEDFCIRIENKDQIHSVISRIIDKALSEAPEEVMDCLTESDKTPFYEFVKNTVNNNINNIKEYGEKDQYDTLYDIINNSVQKYIKVDVFVMNSEIAKLEFKLTN